MGGRRSPASSLLVLSIDFTEDDSLLACDYRYTVASGLSLFLTVLGHRHMEMRPLLSIAYFDPPRKSVFESIQLFHLINNGLHTMYIVFRQ